MTPQEVIAAIYRSGGRLRLDLPQPCLDVPPSLKPLLDEHRDLLRSSIDLGEVRRRAGIFREQINAWAMSGRPAVPAVVVPDRPTTATGCTSCGEPLRQGTWRCPNCTAALYEALCLTDEAADA
jgi:hypothetical protein